MGIYFLEPKQIRELRLVRDEDGGCLARGDQADLCQLGLAKAPTTSSGFYQLTSFGMQARQDVLERYGPLGT